MGGSRRDHYAAATDFWRVMQEIMERRFRWNLRQVVSTAEETQRAADETYGKRSAAEREQAEFIAQRLAALRTFFAAVDVGIGAFTQGKAFTPDALQVVGAARATSRARPT
jgi:DNA-binding transcriptional regulator GbsR (MarR family)